MALSSHIRTHMLTDRHTHACTHACKAGRPWKRGCAQTPALLLAFFSLTLERTPSSLPLPSATERRH